MKCPSWDGVERFIFHQLILKTYIFKILCDYKKTTYVCSRIILGVFVNNKMNTACALVCFLLVSVSVLAGSHTLTVLATYIRGEKAFSASIMLDDITVGYYDSETKIYVARGNTTNEDDVIDPNIVRAVSENVLVHFIERSHRLRPVNDTESHVVYQFIGFCEQSDNKIGQMISKTAYRGSTFDELQIFDGNITYQLFYTEPETIRNLEQSKSRLEKVYYPACINMLKNYLKKRETQLNRKVKPQVRLIQKANSDSGGSRVSCLATGFYPRHINLTLFRDGQTVSDHEITGGDLLPNADGTYQMRKSLEISAADKHKYTCSVTHLSLDNKLDIDLEYPGETFVVVVLALGLVLLMVVAIFISRRRYRSVSSSSDYSSASTILSSAKTYQGIGLCELRDDNKPGQIIAKTAFDGSTTEEVGYFGGKFTYKGPLKYSDENTNPYLQLFMWYHEMLCFPHCIKTLKTLTTNWTVTLGNELLQLQKGSHKVLMILIKILPFLEDTPSSYHRGVLLSGVCVLLLLCVILSIAIAICMTSQAERQRDYSLWVLNEDLCHERKYYK
uniref:Ig-like domain-containing protein n=1 Tax=Cyprinus carpio TaxID=7962 RepID=A0A8C2GUT6_CYPCA